MIKTFGVVLFLLLILSSCSSKSQETINEIIPFTEQSEVLFQIKTEDPDYFEVFPDSIIPWISIQDAAEEVKMLIGKNDIVVKGDAAIIIIDYPLSKAIEVEIKSDNPIGFTRSELVLKISKEYKRVYREEEESTSVKTVPVDEREGVVNRNTTDGKYGIWGHDLVDLDLSAIYIHRTGSGKPRLDLNIES